MKPLPPFLRRWWWVPPVMIVALGLAWLLYRPAPDAAVPPADGVAAGAGSETAAPLAADHVVEARPAAAGIADIFAVRTWEPPPPPVDTTPPPPPQAPPLPFSFLGRIVEPGKGVAFMLSQGGRVLVVRVGDSIGENYRLEKYENGQLLFRYRPMNISQTLAIGDRT